MVDGVLGGAGFAALFGGLMANNVGWRWIFILCAAASVLGLLMVRGTPESKVHGTSGSSGYQLDIKGIATFMVAMVALQVLVTLGGTLGWTSIASVVLLATAVIVGFLFFRVESGNPNAFVDFRLFKNRTYAGATLSNLLLNAVAGIIIVAMTLVQVGGGLSAQEAGFLTLGYAVSIVVFIRVGERLLQRFGARLPMIWGCLIVAAAIVLLMPTNLVLGSYRILAFVAFTLFGVGLGFYATPSTDAAISNLPMIRRGPDPASTRWPRHSVHHSAWPSRPRSSRRSVLTRAESIGFRAFSASPADRTTSPSVVRRSSPSARTF